MPKRCVRDDLFSIFPDLPRQRHPTRIIEERIEWQLAEAQRRVSQNILRRREAIERLRSVIARRRLR